MTDMLGLNRGARQRQENSSKKHSGVFEMVSDHIAEINKIIYDEV